MFRRLCALACALFFVFVASNAHAADVGIVARDPNDPFVARLILELSQLSLSAARIDSASASASRDTAVLLVGDEIELVDNRTQERRKLAATRSDALKVAEEVHALMLPLVARPAPPPSAPEPPAPSPPAVEPPPLVRPPPPPVRPSFEASAGAGAMFGASTPGLVVGASFAWLPLHGGRASAGIAATGLFAAIAEGVTRTQGSAEVRPLLLGPEIIARYAITPALSLDAAVGGFAAYVSFRGDAAPPLAAQTDDAWTFSPAARLRAQVVLGNVGVFVEGRAGAAVPAIAVRFAGEAVHEWGRPWTMAGGGASLAF